MGLGCCSRLAKYFLFAFNFLFWIVGAILLGVGIWVLVDRNAVELLHVATVSTSDSLVRGSAITLVVAGAFVFFIAFFGCFGACRESPCMLMTYAVIVGFLFVIQITAGILGAVFKDQIIDELSSSMNQTVTSKYGQPGFNETTQSFDYMQRYFKCCGVIDGPEEWQYSSWGKTHQEPVPITCCVLTNTDRIDEVPVAKNETLCYSYATNQTDTTTGKEYVHYEGCKPQLEDWVVGHAAILIGVAFGLAIVQIFGICFACMVSKSVRSQYEYV